MPTAQRSLQGRIGAFVTHSRHDPRETTAAARAAFLSRFLDEVDPERELPEPERLRRAGMARRAYFARLAWRSSAARSKKKAPSATTGNASEEVERASAHTTAS